MRTHVEKWLKINRPRLSEEQVVVIKEFIISITPESYQVKRNYVKVMQEAEKLYAKAEIVFSRDEIMQFGFLSGEQCNIS
jgi:F420-0:gamma-glutamyl ligase